MKHESGRLGVLPTAPEKGAVRITARLADTSGDKIRWIRGTIDHEESFAPFMRDAARKFLSEEEQRIRKGSCGQMQLLNVTFTLEIRNGQSITSKVERQVRNGEETLENEQEIAAAMVQRTKDWRAKNEAA